MITSSQRISKLHSIVDIDFLNRLCEVVKLMGHADDSVIDYVKNLHKSFSIGCPDLSPYRVIDDQHAGPGKLVFVYNGQRGRTYNNLDIVDGKVQVFVETGPNEFSDTAMLIDPARLNVYGYIQ